MRAMRFAALAYLALALCPVTVASAQVDDPAYKTSRMGDKYKEWLAEVAVLLTKPERKQFLALDKDYQRDGFIRKFWEARNPYPGASFNPFKAQWERRVADVRDMYGNITEERAVIKLLHGEPANVYRTNCLMYMWKMEIWYYRVGNGVPEDVYLIFYQFNDSGTFKLWHRADGLRTLMADRAPEAMLENDSPDLFNGWVAHYCLGDSQVIMNAVRSVGVEDLSHLIDGLFAAPRSRDPEWLASFRGVSTDLPEGAPELKAAAEVKFPARDNGRTVVQGIVLVPVAAATPVDLEGNRSYNFLLTGELLQNNELVESFRYRFDLPAATVSGDTLPLAFERTAWAGDYVLIVRVEDLHSHRNFRDERPIHVPSPANLPDVAAPRQSPEVTAVLDAARAELAADAVGSAAAAPAGGSAPNPLNAAVPGAGAPATAGPGVAAAPLAGGSATGAEQAAIRLVPPVGEQQTGSLRVEAKTGGQGIRKVTFFLDGKAMLTRVREPYTVELNIGATPVTREVRATAYGADGREMASDILVLNPPKQRFAVRLIEPRAGVTYKGQVLARVQMMVPDGGSLDRLEVFLDDQRLATLYQPPFAQVVPLGAKAGARFVRAVAYLADGATAEDLAVINSPDVVERLDVRLIELYASVMDRKGRPLSGLAEGDFKVLDCGEPQRLLRFEHVEDLPLRLMFAIDTSASMAVSLPQVQKAALAFLTRTITPRDRAALLTFNDSPMLRLPFSNDLAALGGTLAGLNAERGTALFDSVVYGLSYMKGAEHSQSALILFTDGGDHISKLSFEETLRFARRSGIAIYAIGAQVSHLAIKDRNHLAQLAEETGGQSYFIESASELDRVYAAIAEELRSRYLLAYQPTGKGCPGDYRPVEVRVAADGARVKAIHGYYP
jgi:VWFA-related protein